MFVSLYTALLNNLLLLDPLLLTWLFSCYKHIGILQKVIYFIVFEALLCLHSWFNLIVMWRTLSRLHINYGLLIKSVRSDGIIGTLGLSAFRSASFSHHSATADSCSSLTLVLLEISSCKKNFFLPTFTKVHGHTGSYDSLRFLGEGSIIIAIFALL